MLSSTPSALLSTLILLQHAPPSVVVVTMCASVWADTGVFSACGTHLGSFLPDAKGDRWCLDTSCLAGNPQ